MSYLAPLAGVDLEARLRTWREAGFTPAQAMMLYDEMRRFGHGSCRREPVSEIDQQWDALRLRHCERLLAIGTPADWQTYLEDMPHLVMGGETGMAEMQALLSWWVANPDCLLRIERSDMIARVSGAFAYNMPPQWEAWQDLGLEWEDLEAAIQADHTVQPEAPTTGQPVQEAMEQAVASTSLRGVEWGMADSAMEGFAGDLAHNIQQANQLLETRTGWRGGVLGLGGRLLLRLGLCNSGEDGNCGSDLQEGRITLNTAARVGWSAVAHEWLHGLDFAMGHDAGRPAELASHLHDGELPRQWKAMLSQMTGYRFDENAGKRVVEELSEGFARRWSGENLPAGLQDAMLAIRQERQASIGGEGREHQWARLRDLFAAGNAPENADLRAEIAMTELELLDEQAKLVAEGKSIWVQFAERFQANILERHPERAEAFADYLLQPSEQAAHSFEATFGPQGAFITDVSPETTSLRYPLPSEAMGQSLAWRRFFKSTKPWWDQQRPGQRLESTVPATNSLSERLAAQRAQHGAAQEPLPIAARARLPNA